MDPHNASSFVAKETETYWQNVDLYLGGMEARFGHLLYSRFWHLFTERFGSGNGERAPSSSSTRA
jgi:leucyl-tRNA synthetase